MTNAKDAFMAKETLRKRAAAFVHQDWFTEFMTYTRAHVMELRSLSIDEQEGIRLFTRAMTEITVQEDSVSDLPGPGLRHDLDVDRAKQDEPTTKTSTEKG